VVLDEQQREIYADSLPFGKKTNNEAEYLTVLAALHWLQRFNGQQTLEKVRFVLDSKLVVEQLTKRWKIKEPRLKKLAQQCWQLLTTLPFPVEFFHVLRHENARADLLANQAMDKAQE